MNSMIREKKKNVVKKSNSQKHSRSKAKGSDLIVEANQISTGFTYVIGETVPQDGDGVHRARRPNRSAPVRKIDDVSPCGEELDRLVDQFPAPSEWASSHRDW